MHMHMHIHNFNLFILYASITSYQRDTWIDKMDR